MDVGLRRGSGVALGCGVQGEGCVGSCTGSGPASCRISTTAKPLCVTLFCRNQAASASGEMDGLRSRASQESESRPAMSRYDFGFRGLCFGSWDIGLRVSGLKLMGLPSLEGI